MSDPMLTYVPLLKLRGYPPSVTWLPAAVDGWRAVHETYGVVRPLIVSRRSGRVLSPAGEWESLTALATTSRQNPPLPGVRIDAAGAWSVPCYLVDVAEADEATASLILSGGIDRALAGRMTDESMLGVLLERAERDFEAVKVFGIDLDELQVILEAASVEPDEPPPAPAPVVPGLTATPDDWGIPTLDLALQGEALLPGFKWGTVKRGDTLQSGCLLHFYTHDSKFSALVKDIAPVVACRPAAVVELNFSTRAEMPGALVLGKLYQKRVVSAAMQAAGLRLWVDLNVDRRWLQLNLLGVPVGWRSYANRAMTSDLAHLDEAYALACERAGGSDVRYLVYGGGKRAADYCEQRGWWWLPEDADVKRGRTVGANATHSSR